MLYTAKPVCGCVCVCVHYPLGIYIEEFWEKDIKEGAILYNLVELHALNTFRWTGLYKKCTWTMSAIR